MEETRIFYYINNEKTPLLIKCRCRPDQITLGHFKKVLKRPVSQFLFKSVEEDIGEFKEEITEDDAKLPHINGKVTAWLIISEQETESGNDSSSVNETCKTKKDIHVRMNEESQKINILLLGETGVGKSTWINGFVNYLTYESLEAAEGGEPVSLIPTRFSLTNSDYEDLTIVYNVEGDRNESTEKVGESATQSPKSYLFDVDSMEIRIIDTPGIGATSGLEKDKENMQNILSYLSQYEQLNGIIILLKPNNARLTPMFEFCIKELLKHLHKDVCKNMLICFTNARGTDYRPGDTLKLLKELLSRNQIIDVKLNKDTIYCMDNEAVRYLMANKQFKYDKNETLNFAASWKKAVEESTRMITYISSLEPHRIQDTLSINEIRRSIIELSRPVAEIAMAIQTNINKIKDEQLKEIDSNKQREELCKQLLIPEIRPKTIMLDHPRTVCTSSKCIKCISSTNAKSDDRYKTICHDPCSEITVDRNVIGGATIWQCEVMKRGWLRFWRKWCYHCECEWCFHMNITYDVTQETVMVVDPKIKESIDETDGFIKTVIKYKQQLNENLNKLNHEKQRLTEINAYFACFLKHNSLIPSNDALLNYLNYLIRNEEDKAGGGSSSEAFVGLTNLKEKYEKEIRVIEACLKTNTDATCLDMDNINKLMKELQNLPTVGAMIKDIMTIVREANEASTRLSEKHVKIPQTSVVSSLSEKVKDRYYRCYNYFTKK